jgi:hypothetical protein
MDDETQNLRGNFLKSKEMLESLGHDAEARGVVACWLSTLPCRKHVLQSSAPNVGVRFWKCESVAGTRQQVQRRS